MLKKRNDLQAVDFDLVYAYNDGYPLVICGFVIKNVISHEEEEEAALGEIASCDNCHMEPNYKYQCGICKCEPWFG